MTGGKVSTARLIATMCAAEVLGMLGNATFAALIPSFREAWALSNTEAGWISGVYYAGYVAAVPVLVSMTDRRDAKTIYLASTSLTGLSALGFALLAGGLWSAAAFQMLAGVGLAGTYMVGLKLLTDQVSGAQLSRAVAFYTAHFGIGMAFSTFAAGEVSALFGWRWAFAAASLGSLAALALVWRLVPGGSPGEPAADGGHALDLRPVFANRPALAYVLGYAAHVWELFGTRTWIVAFIVYAFAVRPPEQLPPFSPTQIATVVLLLGLPGSILGNEVATRFGRRRVAGSFMTVAALLSSVVGFAAGLPIWWLIVLLALHHALLMADSSALTAGAVARAAPGRRGATMAVHTLLGFGTGVVSPLAFGAMLDLAGGAERTLAWGCAFILLGLGPLLVGLPVLARLGRRADTG